MAAVMSAYEGPAKIFVDGKLQAEATRVRIQDISNNQKVMTMIKGLAGKSDGPREAAGTIEGAIPRSGYETSFREALYDGAVLSIQYKDGGESVTYAMWVDDMESIRENLSPAAFTANLVGKRVGQSGILGALGL